jgi:hypothetical protein
VVATKRRGTVSRRSLFTVTGGIIGVGVVTALAVAFTTIGNEQSLPSLGAPVSLSAVAVPDAALSALDSAANVAKVDAASLKRVGNASGPWIVYGDDRSGAVQWSIESTHAVTSFKKVADSLSSAPVAFGVETHKTDDGGIVSAIAGLFDTTKIRVVRITMSDGSVVDASVSPVANSSSAFALTTAENVNPVLIEAVDSTGTVVYRRQIDVSPQCFAADAHCGG